LTGYYLHTLIGYYNILATDAALRAGYYPACKGAKIIGNKHNNK